MAEHICNYLTIDVEEYFQVAAFADIIRPADWSSLSSRVTACMDNILMLLEEYQTKATFFIVGWTGERHPELVRRIHDLGHGIGCHSYLHQKIYEQTPDEFRQDTKRAKDILEGIIGRQVTAYRAPSYSITARSMWALPILAELGFRVDSSIFPVLHDNYGIPDAPRFAYTHSCCTIREYPLSTIRFAGKNVPVAGGGYFRLFPYPLTRYCLRRINRLEKKPFVFYIHPWEIDPEQPRFNQAGYLSKFRHYNNLHITLDRFTRLLQDFRLQPLPES